MRLTAGSVDGKLDPPLAEGPFRPEGHRPEGLSLAASARSGRNRPGISANVRTQRLKGLETVPAVRFPGGDCAVSVADGKAPLAPDSTGGRLASLANARTDSPPVTTPIVRCRDRSGRT